MSSDAERLHEQDTREHKERAWVFWAMCAGLTTAFTIAFPPTRALGAAAGWAIAAAFNLSAAAYAVRMALTRGDVSQRETEISTTVPVFSTMIGQWLAGGYRSPIQLVLALFIFGAAGVLHGKARLLHLALCEIACLLPLAYGTVSGPVATTGIVWAVILLVQAGFLYEYGLRLRAQRLALYEAERSASARALTDALTGLGNRRALELELDGAAEKAGRGEPMTIVYLDLDGFKAYNDRFGHGTGDALLQRLGSALRVCVEERGRAFRIGGDEFCAVLDGHIPVGDPLIAAIRAALSEQGSGFKIGPSCGVVAMPEDVTDVRSALRMADERMYSAKRSGRPSPAQEISRVLVRALSEHQAAGLHHDVDLSRLGRGAALRLGLPEDEAEMIGRAAELHDIGKIAIPDPILAKPGPLDAAEWALMRQHTVIGERILASSPSFVKIGELVRSSHERPDGAGYPDRLRGDEIPLGARIVAVCDAYAAMRSDRPYRAARSEAEAMAELTRGSGTQFDGAVVEALAQELAAERSRALHAVPAAA